MSLNLLGTEALSLLIAAAAAGTYQDKDGRTLEIDACVAAELGRKVGPLLAARISGELARVDIHFLPAEMPPPLKLDGERLYWRGKLLLLTPSEVRLIRLLAGRAPIDVSYRALYDAARGTGFAAGTGVEGYRSNVRQTMKRIRAKFLDADPSFDRIKTYAGFGYGWLVTGAQAVAEPQMAEAG